MSSGVRATLLAASLAASLSIVAVRIGRGIPLTYVSRGELVRALFGAALASAMAQLAATVAGAETRASIVASLVVAMTFTGLLSRRGSAGRNVRALAASLPRSRNPGAARRRLRDELTRLASARISAREKVGLLIDVLSAYRRAGLLDDALTLADSVEAARATTTLAHDALDDASARRLTFERAALAFTRGDLEGGEATIRSASSDGSNELAALVALAHAVQGGADQALECLERGDFRGEAGAIARAAEAHALASMGRDEEAATKLGDLASEHGMVGLSWALRPVGPASDAARHWLRRSMATDSSRL